MTKEQLQFFYNEIMGMFGWDDGDEASGVDPLLWAKKEYEIRNVKLAQLRAENKNDKKMLAEDGLVFLQCFRLLGMDASGASTKDIPAMIAALRAELDEMRETSPYEFEWMEKHNDEVKQLRAELDAANKAVEEYTRPLEPDDLVAVAHWSDFDTADAVQVGRFSHFRDGHYYILESGRGWRYCRRVLPLAAHPKEQK